jgi:predicted nucleic acid-binding protein
MSIFLDTTYFIAYADSRDKYHEEAVQLAERIASGIYGEKVSSDYVFDETVTFVLVRQNFEKAKEIGNKILNYDITVEKIASKVFHRAWELFKKRKNLSFTDCTIVEHMKENKIKCLATFDSGFNQFKNEIEILP